MSDLSSDIDNTISTIDINKPENLYVEAGQYYFADWDDLVNCLSRPDYEQMDELMEFKKHVEYGFHHPEEPLYNHHDQYIFKPFKDKRTIAAINYRGHRIIYWRTRRRHNIFPELDGAAKSIQINSGIVCMFSKALGDAVKGNARFGRTPELVLTELDLIMEPYIHPITGDIRFRLDGPWGILRDSGKKIKKTSQTGQ